MLYGSAVPNMNDNCRHRFTQPGSEAFSTGSPLGSDAMREHVRESQDVVQDNKPSASLCPGVLHYSTAKWSITEGLMGAVRLAFLRFAGSLAGQRHQRTLVFVKTRFICRTPVAHPCAMCLRYCDLRRRNGTCLEKVAHRSVKRCVFILIVGRCGRC
jgi:hypothetical protein